MGLLARLSGGALFIVVFALLAILAWRTIPATVAAIEAPQAATDYAQAWERGHLDDITYDPASGPNISDGEGDEVAKAVLAMVQDISGEDEDHPETVRTEGLPRTQAGNSGELRDGDLVQQLEVTWDLGASLGDRRLWTYRTDVVIRETEGRERVMWRPSTVHPALAQGLVLRSQRLVAPRAQILDATEQPVGPDFAPALVGSAQPATAALAASFPARVVPGDLVGIGGLQHTYDARLAGSAGVEVEVARVEGYAPLEPDVTQVHVAPPVPGRPLQLTLDPGWQARARAAVADAATPTALVALNALTGEVIADANAATDDVDMALQGRYPPGSAFRPVTTLALARYAGLDATSQLDCSSWSFEGQRFTSAPPAQGAATALPTAFAHGCRSGFARASAALTHDQLAGAAATLGFGVAAQMGTPSFVGSVPAPGDDLGRVQNALGEGRVLASPLSMARMSAAVAAGTERAPQLVVPLTASPSPSQDQEAGPAPLDGATQALLQQLMATSVQLDANLTALRGAAAGRVLAVGGSATGYGPASDTQSYAWCTGSQGTIAFAVLVAGDGARPAQVSTAAGVAADFLG